MQIRPLCLLAATPALRLAPPVMQMVSQPVSNFGYTPGTDYSQGFMQPAGNNYGQGFAQPTGNYGQQSYYDYDYEEDSSSYIIRGGTSDVWSYSDRRVQAAQIVLSSEGGPLDAETEVYQGTNSAPLRLRTYSQNGEMCPFSAVIQSPYEQISQVEVSNVGPIVDPIDAAVVTDSVDMPKHVDYTAETYLQGGAMCTFKCEPSVESVQVLLNTNGRPLNAKIEVLQGPNDYRQIIELTAHDGLNQPLYCFLDTPGAGHVVRVVNNGPMYDPITASVVPLHESAPTREVGLEPAGLQAGRRWSEPDTVRRGLLRAAGLRDPYTGGYTYYDPNEPGGRGFSRYGDGGRDGRRNFRDPFSATRTTDYRDAYNGGYGSYGNW